MTDTFSHWQSNRRYQLARRELGGLTLVQHQGRYALINRSIEFFEADSLTDAIERADQMQPPKGWDWVARMWISRHWLVKPEGEGWKVYNTHGVLMSKQLFTRSDLARKWCEVRKDRIGLSLRGPKPSPWPKRLPTEVCK